MSETKVLLHCCCAPCSSAIIEWMLQNDVTPVLYYCNPNIYPEEEYLIRKRECTRYAQKLGLDIYDDDYDHEQWHCSVHGLEGEPERGGRCLECFRMRLLRAARKTRELGLTTFTTTLASSRWKRLDQITEAGNWAAEQEGVTFDSRNWRKGGLQQRRNELLKENGFYNQLYCGCEYSLNARLPMMSKADIRHWIAELKRAYGKNSAESKRICRKVMETQEWQKSETVLLYHALPDEVDTEILLDEALRSGKKVLLPKVNGDDLTLHEYTGPDSVASGAYGILEPVTSEITLNHSPLSVNLIVTPGVAFDKNNHRLGRGKGYYDRLFAKLKLHHLKSSGTNSNLLKPYLMGVCFPFQLLDFLPSEEHDIPMDTVIS